MKHVTGKGIVDTLGRKVMSKREADLALDRAYGRQGDIAAFTRLCIESRVSRGKLAVC